MLFDRINKDTELAQSAVRFGLGTIVLVYLVFLGADPSFPSGAYLLANLALCLGYIYAGAGAIAAWTYFYPGSNSFRKIVAMLYDYGFIGIFMTTGGETTYPLFAALVWVSVGNGIRFGRDALIAASVIALITLSLIWMFNPYWRDHPYLAATLLITVIVVPAYAFSLLSQVRQATAQVARINFRKSQFMAQASHDLRHPLHALNLLTTQLSKTDLSDAQRDMLRKIDASALTATGMLNSFLDLSIIETGHLQAKREPIEIAFLLGRLKSIFSVSAQEAHVDLRIAPTRMWINSDPTVIQTMLQNLLSNVIKYANGQPALVGIRHRADGIWFEVHDRGEGFGKAADVSPLQNDRVPQSAGLGLKIVSELALVLNAKFELQGASPKGTIARIGPFPQCDKPLLVKPRQSNTALSGLSVLLAELDDDARDHVLSSLEHWGCVVTNGDTHCAAEILITSASTLIETPPAGIRAIIHIGSALQNRSVCEVAVHHIQTPVDRAQLRSVLMAVRLLPDASIKNDSAPQ